MLLSLNSSMPRTAPAEEAIAGAGTTPGASFQDEFAKGVSDLAPTKNTVRGQSATGAQAGAANAMTLKGETPNGATLNGATLTGAAVKGAAVKGATATDAASEAATKAASAASEADTEAELDPEQWLLNVIEQQLVELQVRDLSPTNAPGALPEEILSQEFVPQELLAQALRSQGAQQSPAPASQLQQTLSPTALPADSLLQESAQASVPEAAQASVPEAAQSASLKGAAASVASEFALRPASAQPDQTPDLTGVAKPEQAAVVSPAVASWLSRTNGLTSEPASTLSGKQLREAVQGVTGATSQFQFNQVNASRLNTSQLDTNPMTSGQLDAPVFDGNDLNSNLLAAALASANSEASGSGSLTLHAERTLAPLNGAAGQMPHALQEAGFQSAQKLAAPEAKWGEQLLHTLREQVQVQLHQRIQQASIRLDPPELGSLEIFLSHEAGRLNVQINASQADVARLLQQTSERLRQELATGQFIQVSIGTGSESSSARDQSRPQEQRLMAEESIQATSRAAPATQLQSNQLHAKQSPASDVLVTV